MEGKTIPELEREASEIEWQDEELDTRTALEILAKNNPSGQFHILEDLVKPENPEAPHAIWSVRINSGVLAVLKYLTEKYGEEKGFLINIRLTEKLFGSNLSEE